jgi:hypothetical protein
MGLFLAFGGRWLRILIIILCFGFGNLGKGYVKSQLKFFIFSATITQDKGVLIIYGVLLRNLDVFYCLN